MKDMTLDEALTMLTDTPEATLQKVEIASRTTGNVRTAYDMAFEIARECIKRCRDFEELREKIKDDRHTEH